MSGVPSLLALLFPLLVLGFVYVLTTPPAAGRTPWGMRLCLVGGGALLFVALAVDLGAPGFVDLLSAALSAVGIALLLARRDRDEGLRRAREDALRQSIEETSRRLVALGGRRAEVETEKMRLEARVALLEEENAGLRSALEEKDRRFQTLDWRLRHERALDDLERRNQELQDLARYDALTRLYNRRYIDRMLDSLGNRPEIEELAVALFDVDHFKAVNDRYGHPVGDRVLIDVASIFRRHLRQGDIVGRYGGEEFIVLLLSIASASPVCEKLREAVENHAWSEVAPGLRVTVSAGVAGARRPIDTRRLVAEADRLLYRAKEAGRNRIAAEG
jgi:diguanylate cyclase (GGDEF)-like protein